MDEKTTGGEGWQSRKAQVRKAYFKTMDVIAGAMPEMPETLGGAPSPGATEEAFSVMAGVPPKASSGTSATAMAPSGMPSDSPTSTTPAVSTSESSASSMVWMVHPIGFVEANLKRSIVGPNGSLMPGLDPQVLASLQQLAIGRSEPIEEIVQQIAEFFIEAEDERAEIPLSEALAFYVRQMGAPA